MNIYAKLRSLGAVSSIFLKLFRFNWGAVSKSGSFAKPVLKRLLSLTLLALLVPSVYAQDSLVDSDGDGVPDSLETQLGRDPFAVDYMVAVGDKFSCALDGSGVSCWGDSANGKLDVPDLVNPLRLLLVSITPVPSMTLVWSAGVENSTRRLSRQHYQTPPRFPWVVCTAVLSTILVRFVGVLTPVTVQPRQL